ncbi:unnamed protein product [Cuscuta campestris]|uniref:Uncharacterized protein n=1 Tax=Cuscuta campestris TaxID=132261 RepID=A0A484NQ41_9ASTE|nr:unnamed protein product [Cuscuta campestris]
MGRGGEKRRGTGTLKNPDFDNTWLNALLESDLSFRAEWNSNNVVSSIPLQNEENTSIAPSTNHLAHGSIGGSQSPLPIGETTQGIEPPKQREEQRNEDERMVIVPGDFSVNKTVREEVKRINKRLFNGKATRFLGIQNARDIYWEQLEQRFRWAPEHHSKASYLTVRLQQEVHWAPRQSLNYYRKFLLNLVVHVALMSYCYKCVQIRRQARLKAQEQPELLLRAQENKSEVERLKEELEEKDATMKAEIDKLQKELDKTKGLQQKERKRRREVVQELKDFKNSRQWI